MNQAPATGYFIVRLMQMGTNVKLSCCVLLRHAIVLKALRGTEHARGLQNEGMS